MRVRIELSMLLVVAFGGCADISTISRRTPLTPGGTAIHLDAPQRLVYSDIDGRICAEPTPDALQAYAASLGLGVGAPTQGAASVAQAMQTSAASIGLHTQSITLMRDAMYRICEASYNKRLNNADVMQMMQRSQDLTLGVLAIEQLTGAVQAKQVRLGGTSQASASANIANTEKAREAAKQTEADRQKVYDRAQERFRVAKERQAAAQLAVETATAAADEEKKRLAVAVKASRDADVESIEKEIVVAEDGLKAAREASAAIQAQFNTALTSANATATGSGEFSTGGDSTTKVDAAVAASLARAVADIVDSIVNRTRMTEMCGAFMGSSALENLPNMKFILDECRQIFEQNRRNWATMTNSDAEIARLQAQAALADAQARAKAAGTSAPVVASRTTTTTAPAVSAAPPPAPVKGRTTRAL